MIRGIFLYQGFKKMDSMITHLIAFFFLFFSINAVSQKLTLSTHSDSAAYYYHMGWQQVMDAGNYTASEAAYRKMMTFDSDFLLGLSLLARITRDLNERQYMQLQLEARRYELIGDERLLLDNYIALVKLTNLRATDPQAAKIQLENVFKANELNLKTIVHSYPDEIYYKAEYIEVLHHNHGVQRALDSLYQLATPSQQNESFLLGYAASMEAEAGNFGIALSKAKQLEIQIKDKQSPKPYVVYGDIYLKQGNYKKANYYIEQALKRDLANIDAQRLKEKIKNEKR
jgi:tetratricopeptide (TPR) repeat protein